MSRKVKISLAAYCIVMIAFFAWLFFANEIVVHLSDVDVPLKISDGEIDSFHDDPVRYSIDSSGVDEDLQTLNITGWVFCETDTDNSQRRSSFLLINENNSYELPCENTPRADIEKALSIELPNPLVGYKTKSSLMLVEDGVYDLYLACWENDTNSGIADTGKQVVLDKSGCSIVPWRGSKVEPDAAIHITNDDENSKSALDVATINNGGIELRGWTFVEGLDCSDQKVYISLKDESGSVVQYTTKRITRVDVANAYKDQLYTNSGYATSIPAEDIADGTWTIDILVENGGEVWSSVSRTVVKAGDSLELLK